MVMEVTDMVTATDMGMDMDMVTDMAMATDTAMVMATDTDTVTDMVTDTAMDMVMVTMDNSGVFISFIEEPCYWQGLGMLGFRYLQQILNVFKHIWFSGNKLLIFNLRVPILFLSFFYVSHVKWLRRSTSLWIRLFVTGALSSEWHCARFISITFSDNREDHPEAEKIISCSFVIFIGK